MLRRKKRQDQDKADKKKSLERDRLQKAEEAYLERLASSIRQGNAYVTRPKSPPPAPRQAESIEIPPVPPLSPPQPPPAQPGTPRQTPLPVHRDPPTSPPIEGLEGIPQSSLEKVLKPGAVPLRPPTPPQPPVPPPAVESTPLPESSEPLGTFPRGTILQLEDGTVAIYKDPVKGKEYEIVYALRANGKVRPEGIALYAYEAKKIGRLPQDLFEEVQKALRWDRDAICFHLDKYEYCSLIPLMERPAGMAASAGAAGSDPTKKAVAPDPPTSPLLDPARELIRGRRVYISFGPGKTWEAVYWGKDLLGHVVAHRTHNEWALMHLDIKRFRDSIEVGEILKEEEIKAIQRDILNTQERSGNGE